MGARIDVGTRETGGSFFFCLFASAAFFGVDCVLQLFFTKRHLAIVGALGHVATFDWQAGTLHTELQLQETCRDIT
jgi:hypothetical protein